MAEKDKKKKKVVEEEKTIPLHELNRMAREGAEKRKAIEERKK